MKYETETGTIFTATRNNVEHFAVRGRVSTDHILDFIDDRLPDPIEKRKLIHALDRSWETILKLTHEGGALTTSGVLVSSHPSNPLPEPNFGKNYYSKEGRSMYLANGFEGSLCFEVTSTYMHYLYSLSSDGKAVVSLSDLSLVLAKYTRGVYRTYGVPEHPLAPFTATYQVLLEIAETWGQGKINEQRLKQLTKI